MFVFILCTMVLSPVPDRAPDISLSRRDSVILTKGQKFELVCSAANVNYDLSVKWITPDGTVR